MSIFSPIIAILFSIAFLALRADAEPYDLVLRNGRIVDGTGKAAFDGDVAVKEGRIVAVGKVEGKAQQEFDVSGLVVAPGFIDVHTHAEEIDALPLAENFLRMGVSTLVLGNCGSSVLNVGEFFSQLDAQTVSPNIATLIGHGTVRMRAMRGSFMRAPDGAELELMKNLVEKAMQDGALGLSTGLIYTPGVFAQTEEIIALAKVASKQHGLYATHQRSEAGEIFTSLAEVLRIAKEAQVRTQVSHIKLSGPANWGKAQAILDLLENARKEGVEVSQDQYVYTASSTGISQLIPDAIKDGGRAMFLERVEEPEVWALMAAEMKQTLTKRQSPDFSYAVIASYKPDPTLNGLNIAEAAQRTRGSDDLEAQIHTIVEIEKYGGASAVFHGMGDADLETFMRHPRTMFASDSGIRRHNVAVPHPRGYGNAARVLGLYVREKRVISLEAAVQRMTSLPAQVFRLEQRGQLREGNWADLVVFDPATVTDHATYKDPHHYATGFRYVFVNGVMVVESDRHTGTRPGKTLRRAVPRADEVLALPASDR